MDSINDAKLLRIFFSLVAVVMFEHKHAILMKNLVIRTNQGFFVVCLLVSLSFWVVCNSTAQTIVREVVWNICKVMANFL